MPSTAINAGGLRVATFPVTKLKKQREPRPKQKFDPKYVAAARELRDRYLEHVNKDASALTATNLKYDVSRQIEAAPAKATAMLEAA